MRLLMFALLGSVFARRPAGGSTDAPGMGRAPTIADSFPEQWEYVTSAARKNAVCCSRQAGKTSGAELAAETTLARPGTRVIYATLIRRNAKKLFWWPLLEGLIKRGWVGAREGANESEMMLWLPNGSFLQALSCEKMADLERIRGDQADLFLVDECQAPRDDVLGALVTKIVPMMLAKRRGRLDLLGTVPEVEPCVFANRLDGIDELGKPLKGWKTHGWDCFHNPHMSREAIEAEAAESGLAPGHPIYDREILGLRVKDPSKLAYEYLAGRNDYDPRTVDFTGAGWRHSLGIDLGFQDRDAIVFVAWNVDDAERRLYVRFQWQRNHLDVDDLSLVLHVAYDLFRPQVTVGDHGGHGAVKVMETVSNRLNMPILSKPGDVMVSVGFVNDDYRTGRLLLPTEDIETERVREAGKDKYRKNDRELMRFYELITPDGATLQVEAGKVQKTINPRTRRVEINKQGHHSDLTEALRYAHAGAQHYAASAPAPVKSLDERRAEHLRLKAQIAADPYNPRLRRRSY